MEITRARFEEACQNLLGERYTLLVNDRRVPHDLCREIAQDVFIGVIDEKINHDDLAVVRQTARNLWSGDGVTGFVPE